MTPPIPQDLDHPASVLFLKSGFSREATNIRGENIPTADGLKALIADLVGVSASDYDLPVLAEELASKPDSPLSQLLYELFTVTALHADQLEVLRHRWLRIYTTNYDDAVESAHPTEHSPLTTMTTQNLPASNPIH